MNRLECVIWEKVHLSEGVVNDMFIQEVFSNEDELVHVEKGSSSLINILNGCLKNVKNL